MTAARSDPWVEFSDARARLWADLVRVTRLQDCVDWLNRRLGG